MNHKNVASRFPEAIILPYEDVWPTIADSAFVAPGAVIVGNVTIGAESSIWFHAVLRGDISPIAVGDRTSVQDGTIVHVNGDAPTTIGNDVTIGHGAVVHGTTIRDGVLVGMGAVVMSYSEIGAGAVIAAGAVVTEHAVVPPQAVMVGVPAKQRAALDADQAANLAAIPDRYVRVSRQYRREIAALEADNEH